EIESEIGRMHHDLYELPAAVIRYRRAQSHYTALGDRAAEAALLTRIGQIHHLEGDYPAAPPPFTPPLPLPPAAPPPTPHTVAPAPLGQPLCETGRPAEGPPLVERALPLLESVSAPEAGSTRDQLAYLRQLAG